MRRLLPWWVPVLFALIGYALAMTCQLQESYASGSEPHNVQKSGRVYVMAQDGQTAQAVARHYGDRYAMAGKLTIQLRETASNESTIVWTPSSGSTFIYCHAPRSEWQSILSTGFKMAHAKVENPTGIYRQTIRPTNARTSGTYWNWTPDGQHHRAIGVVTTPSGSGTGFLVSPEYAVTAAHVVSSGNATLRFVDGGRYSVSVVSADRQNDVSLLRLSSPARGRPTLTIGTNPVRNGERLEICGFGGPVASAKGDMRHFHSVALDGSTANSAVLHGDSGGPILRLGTSEVVGVVSGGPKTQPFQAEDGSRWYCVYPTMHSTPMPLRNFGRWLIGAPQIRGYVQPIGVQGGT